jgi:GNAT superfamily N-acetyltransferase
MTPSVTHIVRASLKQHGEAKLLMQEYYEAVGVLKRDTPAELADYLTDSGCGMWIAYVAGIPAGCVVLRPQAVFNHAAECKRLYVRPQFRGLGIAGALLDAMEEHARACRIEWIYLDSKDDLRNALRLYTHRGYQTCERYNDNPQATIFMRKQLGR